MRFKVNKKPKQGDRRYKAKFALFPIRRLDEIIWLEFYYQYQEYRLHVDFEKGDYYKWVNID